MTTTESAVNSDEKMGLGLEIDQITAHKLVVNDLSLNGLGGDKDEILGLGADLLFSPNQDGNDEQIRGGSGDDILIGGESGEQDDPTLAAQEMSSVLNQTFSSASSEINDLVDGFTGKLGKNFDGLSGLLNSSLGGLFDSLSSSLGNLLGSILPQGSGPLLGMVTSILGFAGGGRVQPGRAAIVGERGPEILVPSRSGTIINHGDATQMFLGARGAAGVASAPMPAAVPVPSTKVVVNNHSGGEAKTKQSRGPNGDELIEVIIGRVADDLARGGQMSEVMNNRYGLSARGN